MPKQSGKARFKVGQFAVLVAERDFYKQQNEYNQKAATQNLLCVKNLEADNAALKALVAKHLGNVDKEISETMSDLARAFADDRNPAMNQRQREMCREASFIITSLQIQNVELHQELADCKDALLVASHQLEEEQGEAETQEGEVIALQAQIAELEQWIYSFKGRMMDFQDRATKAEAQIASAEANARFDEAKLQRTQEMAAETLDEFEVWQDQRIAELEQQAEAKEEA